MIHGEGMPPTSTYSKNGRGQNIAQLKKYAGLPVWGLNLPVRFPLQHAMHHLLDDEECDAAQHFFAIAR
jgi:hypothetical protein